METYKIAKLKLAKLPTQLVVLVVFIGFIYQNTFLWLFERYITVDSYYSHGFLVPFVTAILIWLKRKELKAINYSGNNWGLVIVVFSLLAHLISYVLGVFFLSGFSMLCLVFGFSLFLYGREITKKILFPLFFLIFMIPLPLEAISIISFPMKMFVTNSVVFIMKNFMAIPIRNEGFQVFFPNASLIIENPCSGLRSLIVILALGSIFANALKGRIYKKVLLFLFSFLIAIISNMIRVFVLCLAVYIYGGQIAEGFFHDLTGYLVFVFSFIVLWLIVRRFQCKDQT